VVSASIATASGPAGEVPDDTRATVGNRCGAGGHACGNCRRVRVEQRQRRNEFNLTYVFVAHDLGVIRYVSDRIAVMYLGKIVELGPAEEVYSRPIRPYTLSLLSALPIPDPRANAVREQIVLERDIPSPANPPAACRFHTRRPYATEICSQEEPQLVHYGNGQGRLPPPAASRAPRRHRRGPP
jgi:oligopeptide/dipeptide ABC transporter ATP-binding protein